MPEDVYLEIRKSARTLPDGTCDRRMIVEFKGERFALGNIDSPTDPDGTIYTRWCLEPIDA